MPENPSRLPERSGKPIELMTWLREFFSQFQLAWRLFWDERVSFGAKLVPLLTLVYILTPIDLVPDAFLGVGQMDDLVLLLVGLRVFISLCPLELVDEHRQSFTVGKNEDELISDGATIIDLEVEKREPEETATEETQMTQ